MLIDGQFPVAAPPQALLAHLFDARLMASCLPGCETLEPLDDDRYRAVVVIAMAGIKARFDLQVEVTRRDATQIWAVTRGEEGGRASTLQADSQVSLEPSGDGTLVRYRSEVAVTGRLGRFALGMMRKKAQSLGDEFAANLQRRLAEAGSSGVSHGDAAPAPAPREAVPAPRETSTSSGDSSTRPGDPSTGSGDPSTGSADASTGSGNTSVRAPLPLSNRPAPATISPAMTRARTSDRSWLRMLLDWLRSLGSRRPARSPKAGD
jgi:carbon monoxide dehydrogenase subunit G